MDLRHKKNEHVTRIPHFQHVHRCPIAVHTERLEHKKEVRLKVNRNDGKDCKVSESYIS